MPFGISIFFVAIGAILAFAVNVQAQGIDLTAVGVILMLVGFLGLVLSFTLWHDYLPWRRTTVVRRSYSDVGARPRAAGAGREVVEYEERDI
jgi:cytochrome c biogenesis protein CcdA